ncbi:hypothetical protein, partial [Escherichia coli]|uniref:hypothetical protein n=3 Tax=Enterobacteriaceae TaxID=543 RepID=UPI001C7005EA
PQNDVTLKMPAFEWVHVQLHQQKGMISLSPPTICNSAHYFCRAGGNRPDGLNEPVTNKPPFFVLILQQLFFFSSEIRFPAKPDVNSLRRR